MNVLVACEESQEVCKAFRARGHTAFSCDIIPCSGGHPEWHIQADAREIIKLPWDLIIAHPPCTYMSNAGARWLYRGGHLDLERFRLGMEGRDFFFQLYEANCEKIAIENPVPASVFNLPKPSQVIQPYEYGEPWSKKTYLWMKGLPPLIPTNIVTKHYPYITSGSYRKSHDPKYKGASRRGGERQKQKQNISRNRCGYGRTMGMKNNMALTGRHPDGLGSMPHASFHMRWPGQGTARRRKRSYR